MLLSNASAASRRSVIVELEGGVCYAYLTHPNGSRPAFEVLVASSVILTDIREAKRLAKAGCPPPPTRDYTTAFTGNLPRSARDVSFIWSDAGDGIIILVRGAKQAAIAEGRVYSRAIGKVGPYGYPWDEGAVRQAFQHVCA